MLQERTRIEQVEIKASGHVQVKRIQEIVRVNDNGTEEVISSIPHRGVLDPGDPEIAKVLAENLLGAARLDALRKEAESLIAQRDQVIVSLTAQNAALKEKVSLG